MGVGKTALGEMAPIRKIFPRVTLGTIPTPHFTHTSAPLTGGLRWVGAPLDLGGSAWQLLQLAVERPWSAPDGPFVCFLAALWVAAVAAGCRKVLTWSAPGEPLFWFNAPLTYKGLHFCHF